MPQLRLSWSARSLALLAVALVAPSFAQPATQDKGPGGVPGPEPRAAVPTSRGPTTYRKLAPGVMTVIDPEQQVGESFCRHDLIELLAKDPNFAERDWSQGKSPARDMVFRRNVWSLQFAFKPIRFIEVDVPTHDGRMQRKLVWYLVYKVTNPTDAPVAFVPRFVLVSTDNHKVYPDRLIPVAVPLIRKREDPKRPLLNTIEITGKIPPTPKGQDQSTWGVITWEDIDPTTDFFSIYVQGLTNAYLWVDTPGAFKAGSPPGTGRELYPKTLILSFWRPGDTELEHEDEIRYEGYQWQYGQLTASGFIAKKPDPAPAAPAVAEPPDAAPADAVPAEADAAADAGVQ